MKAPLLLVFCFSFLAAPAQEGNNTQYLEPDFKGGKAAFDKYVLNYVNYPTLERINKENANMTAMIYVSKEGKIKFVNVIGKPAFKTETKRILSLMPDWHPGTLNGVAIDTMVTKKIFFSAESRRSKDTTVTEIVTYEVPYSESMKAEEQERRLKRESDMAEARNYFEQASKKFLENDLKSAIELYHKSHDKGLKSNELFYNLGISYLKFGEQEKACPHLAEAARLGDKEAYKLFFKACK